MSEDFVPAPCPCCGRVRTHQIRGDYRQTRPYCDHSPVDYIEEVWFILECRACHRVQFARRWYGSAEQIPCSANEPAPPNFYDWTRYAAADGWRQLGDDIIAD